MARGRLPRSGVVPRVVAASRSYRALVSWSERTGAVTVDGASGFSRKQLQSVLPFDLGPVGWLQERVAVCDLDQVVDVGFVQGRPVAAV